MSFAASGLAHARLSPSAAERWISCPASIRVEQEIRSTYGEAPESEYALEGTAAHALAEMRARLDILGSINLVEYNQHLKIWRKRYPFVTDEMFTDMLFYTDQYLELIRERMAIYPYTQLLLEQRVDTGIPDCGGTGDAILVSPWHVEIIDLKYGQGVPVSSYENPQLMLYGVGTLEMFGDILGHVEVVYMTIHQPRLDSISTYEMNPQDLLAWRDSVIPIAEEARSEHGSFGPSEEACRWCDAKGLCKAQREYATQLDFGQPTDLMTAEELAETLELVPAIERFCASVRDVALDLAYSKGTPVPNHKVVLSSGQRYVRDPEAAIEFLIDTKGFDESQVVNKKIKGIGELEKLLGKAQMASEFGPYLSKSEGKPSLVHESDKRTAISPASQAAADFTQVASDE